MNSPIKRRPRLRGLRNRLTDGVSAVNLKVRIQDRLSITHQLPCLTTASPKRCEHDPRFVVDLHIKNESKLLHEWDNTAYCPVAVMTMVQLAGQGSPSNGLIYISQERAVGIT